MPSSEAPKATADVGLRAFGDHRLTNPSHLPRRCNPARRHGARMKRRTQLRQRAVGEGGLTIADRFGYQFPQASLFREFP